MKVTMNLQIVMVYVMKIQIFLDYLCKDANTASVSFFLSSFGSFQDIFLEVLLWSLQTGSIIIFTATSQQYMLRMGTCTTSLKAAIIEV